MDYCELCFDRPQPLECRGLGKVRLDAVEGGRRLLGELEIRGPVRLHFVEVEAHRPDLVFRRPGTVCRDGI